MRKEEGKSEKGVERRKLYIIIIIFFLFLFIVILAASILIFLYLILSKPPTPSNSISNSKYLQLTDINPLTSKTTYGFVTLQKNLQKKEDYISYSSPTGVYFVISNFGGEEYKCSGTCYCEEEEESKKMERRNLISAGSSTLGRGLFILLTAFSSTLAIEMSKDIFHSKCVQKYNEVCTEMNIKSEIEDCKSDLIDDNNNNEEEEFLFDTKKEDKGVGLEEQDIIRELKEYNCIGHCRLEDDIIPTTAFPNEFIHDLREQCRGLVKTKRIKVKADLKNTFLELAEAKREFYNDLNTFCKNLSFFEQKEGLKLEYFRDQNQRIFRMDDNEFKRNFVCYGGRLDSDLENINCVKNY